MARSKGEDSWACSRATKLLLLVVVALSPAPLPLAASLPASLALALLVVAAVSSAPPSGDAASGGGWPLADPAEDAARRDGLERSRAAPAQQRRRAWGCGDADAHASQKTRAAQPTCAGLRLPAPGCWAVLCGATMQALMPAEPGREHAARPCWLHGLLPNACLLAWTSYWLP